MARLNLYVADDLKRRMDAVKAPVNWSQVAAHAFESKLAEVAASKKPMTMNKTVSKLIKTRTERYRLAQAAVLIAAYEEKFGRPPQTASELDRAVQRRQLDNLPEDENGSIDVAAWLQKHPGSKRRIMGAE